MAVAPYTLHTVTFQGGDPFDIRLPGNPLVRHTGGTTVANVLLNDHLVEVIRSLLSESPNTTVEIRPVDGQSETQRAERETLLGIGQQDRVWPSLACPNCFWLDPLTPTGCGATEWDAAMRETALTMPVAKKALSVCPVLHDK